MNLIIHAKKIKRAGFLKTVYAKHLLNLATFFVLSVFPCPSESQNDDKLILSET